MSNFVSLDTIYAASLEQLRLLLGNIDHLLLTSDIIKWRSLSPANFAHTEITLLELYRLRSIQEYRNRNMLDSLTLKFLDSQYFMLRKSWPLSELMDHIAMIDREEKSSREQELEEMLQEEI